MVKVEKLDIYRKMRLWVNELPEENSVIAMSKISEYSANNDIYWFNGILCLELRIAPRPVSNYAMLCLRFTQDQSSKFRVMYHLREIDEVVKSDIAMKNDIVRNGIVKEYYQTLKQVFDNLDVQNIFPSGTLDILGGRYGYVGSSNMAIKIVLNNLLKLFETYEKLNDEEIGSIILEGCK